MVESVQKVAFSHRDAARNNKMEVMNWHFFTNMMVIHQNIKKLKAKIHWMVLILKYGRFVIFPMLPSGIWTENVTVIILSLPHTNAIVGTVSYLSWEETYLLLPLFKRRKKIIEHDFYEFHSRDFCWVEHQKAPEHLCSPITQVERANYKETSSLDVLTSQNWLMPCL